MESRSYRRLCHPTAAATPLYSSCTGSGKGRWAAHLNGRCIRFLVTCKRSTVRVCGWYSSSRMRVSCSYRFSVPVITRAWPAHLRVTRTAEEGMGTRWWLWRQGSPRFAGG